MNNTYDPIKEILDKEEVSKLFHKENIARKDIDDRIYFLKIIKSFRKFSVCLMLYNKNIAVVKFNSYEKAKKYFDEIVKEYKFDIC